MRLQAHTTMSRMSSSQFLLNPSCASLCTCVVVFVVKLAVLQNKNDNLQLNISLKDLWKIKGLKGVGNACSKKLYSA